MLVLVRKECAEQREASKRTQHRVVLRETGETRAREKARGAGRGGERGGDEHQLPESCH